MHGRFRLCPFERKRAYGPQLTPAMTKANFLRRGRLILLMLLVGLKAVSIARGLALDVRIVNSNPDFPDAKVFLMFGGIASGLDATATVNGAANTKLVEGVSYALSQISDIKLTSFRRGRIYISLGSKLASASAAMAFNPNFSNPSLPDYNTRWDKVEITYSPGDPGSGANLSATDFFSVPLQLNTFATANPDTPSTTLTWRAPTATTFSRLADLSGGNTVAVARGSNGLKTQGYGQVVRIISPSTVANPSVYSSFAPYVDFVKSQELMTLIRGSHSASQSYSFKAVVDRKGEPRDDWYRNRRSGRGNKYHHRQPGPAEWNLHLQSAIHCKWRPSQHRDERSVCDGRERCSLRIHIRLYRQHRDQSSYRRFLWSGSKRHMVSSRPSP